MATYQIWLLLFITSTLPLAIAYFVIIKIKSAQNKKLKDELQEQDISFGIEKRYLKKEIKDLEQKVYVLKWQHVNPAKFETFKKINNFLIIDRWTVNAANSAFLLAEQFSKSAVDFINKVPRDNSTTRDWIYIIKNESGKMFFVSEKYIIDAEKSERDGELAKEINEENNELNINPEPKISEKDKVFTEKTNTVTKANNNDIVKQVDVEFRTILSKLSLRAKIYFCDYIIASYQKNYKKIKLTSHYKKKFKRIHQELITCLEKLLIDTDTSSDISSNLITFCLHNNINTTSNDIHEIIKLYFN